MNITQFKILGELWGSETLLDVYNTLSSTDSSANSGSLLGTRVFYDNDFIASIILITVVQVLTILFRCNVVKAM